VPSEKPVKRLVFRWTALRGLTAILLFFILALFVEYIIVYLFLSSGLTDEFLMSQVVNVPATSFSFTITLSPIFHLIPLGVIVVLVSSWAYLTKYIAIVPQRLSPPRKPQEPRREPDARAKSVRLKSLRRWSKKLRGKLRGISRRAKAAVSRIGGVSYVLERLSFAKATIKSATTILTIFLVSVSLLSLLLYPNLVHDGITGFYEANPWFHGFILWTLEATRAFGETLTPVGWLLSSVDGALHAVALGFWNTLEWVGFRITEAFFELDIVWKYAICQNVAAWISAAVTLLYGVYSSHSHRLYKR
jgi:hypothetical protein